MKRLFIALLGVLSITAMAASPKFAAYLNRYVGVVASYIGNSGTNTSFEVIYERTENVPFKLSEVTAVAAGSETPVTISRVWQYPRDVYTDLVITNFFGDLETNSVFRGFTTVNVTNEVYDSTADTLPVSAYFNVGDKMIADFGSVTGVTLRVIGTAD